MEKNFKKDFSSLEAIDAYIRSFAAENGLDEDMVFMLNFVVEEIFTNMVKYQSQSSNDVKIGLSSDGQTLKVTLTDFGVEYFDPTAAPPVDISRPLSERRPGGLGVHLVKKYVDTFDYRYAGNNSIITLTKNLKDEHV